MAEPATNRPVRVKVAFSLMMTAAVLVALETALWLAGGPSSEVPAAPPDPSLAWKECLQPDGAPDRFRIDPAVSFPMTEMRFAAHPAPGQRRILVLGASVADQLEGERFLDSLSKRRPGKRPPELLNAGVAGRGSRDIQHVWDAFRTKTRFDDVLFALGHNEFMDTLADVYQSAAPEPWLPDISEKTHLTKLLSTGIARMREAATRPNPGADVEVQHYWDVPPNGRCPPIDWSAMVGDYRRRLTQMLTEARQANVRAFAVVLPSNPHWPPETYRTFNDQNRERLPQLRASEFLPILFSGRLKEAIQHYKVLVDLYPSAARRAYLEGLEAEEAKDWPRARELFARARDTDRAPIRDLQSLSDATMQAARETNTPVVDLRACFEAYARKRQWATTAPLFQDFCHFTSEGNELFADTLAEFVGGGS